MKEPEPALQPDSVAEPASEPATVRKEATVQPHRPTVQRLAVKTNLLYDAILMPSLEVEYRIADRWTVNLEGDMAWWNNDGKHKCYQVATISPEGRWWFGQKQGSPWHGHYLGVFGGFTWYDLENGKEGYQGEAECGCQLRLHVPHRTAALAGSRVSVWGTCTASTKNIFPSTGTTCTSRQTE